MGAPQVFLKWPLVFLVAGYDLAVGMLLQLRDRLLGPVFPTVKPRISRRRHREHDMISAAAPWRHFSLKCFPPIARKVSYFLQLETIKVPSIVAAGISARQPRCKNPAGVSTIPVAERPVSLPPFCNEASELRRTSDNRKDIIRKRSQLRNLTPDDLA